MPDSHGDRRLRGNAFKESQYPIVSGTRCVQVHIPDDPTYLHQLAGLMAMATKQFQYQNWDSAHAAIIAQQWKDAYLETDWSECMDCEKIIECIETDEDVQNVLKTFINNHLASLDNNPVGKPLPSSATGAPLGQNPTCDPDILWSQCLMIVKTTNDIIEDLLDKFETLTNPVELTGAALEAIPAAGDTVAAVPNYIGLIQEFLAENYSADYTTTPITGYEDKLAADIFCVCEADCEITIDRIVNILIGRVEERFATTAPALSVLNDLAAWLIGIDTGGEVVADMAFLLVWGGLKFANFVIGGLLNRPRIGDGVIKAWLDLAVNDANNDWIYIVDCIPDTWSKVLFFDQFEYDELGWTFYPNTPTEPRAAWVDGEGWGRGGTSTTPQAANIQIHCLDLPSANYTQVRIYTTEAPTQGFQLRFPNVGGGTYNSGLVGVGETMYQFDIDVTSTGIWLSCGDPNGEDMLGYIYRVDLSGTGESPFD